MTREEQIRQAGIEYTYKDKPMCIGGGIFSEVIDEMNINHAFEEGAKWADKTMIERVCNWLEQNMYIEYVFEYDSDETPAKYVCASACDSVGELINNFRKSMEE